MLIVDARGLLLADSAGARSAARTARGRRSPARCAGAPRRSSARPRRSTRPCSPRRCRSSRTAGPSGRCGSRRAPPPSTGRCGASGSASRSIGALVVAARPRGGLGARRPGRAARCGASTTPRARVAEGDLTVRAKVEGSSEQQSLARTFNEMTERIGPAARVPARVRRRRQPPAAHAARGPAPADRGRRGARPSRPARARSSRPPSTRSTASRRWSASCSSSAAPASASCPARTSDLTDAARRAAAALGGDRVGPRPAGRRHRRGRHGVLRPRRPGPHPRRARRERPALLAGRHDGHRRRARLGASTCSTRAPASTPPRPRRCSSASTAAAPGGAGRAAPAWASPSPARWRAAGAAR